MASLQPQPQETKPTATTATPSNDTKTARKCKGKGGPDNNKFRYRGVRQRSCYFPRQFPRLVRASVRLEQVPEGVPDRTHLRHRLRGRRRLPVSESSQTSLLTIFDAVCMAYNCIIQNACRLTLKWISIFVIKKIKNITKWILISLYKFLK